MFFDSKLNWCFAMMNQIQKNGVGDARIVIGQALLPLRPFSACRWTEKWAQAQGSHLTKIHQNFSGHKVTNPTQIPSSWWFQISCIFTLTCIEQSTRGCFEWPYTEADFASSRLLETVPEANMFRIKTKRSAKESILMLAVFNSIPNMLDTGIIVFQVNCTNPYRVACLSFVPTGPSFVKSRDKLLEAPRLHFDLWRWGSGAWTHGSRDKIWKSIRAPMNCTANTCKYICKCIFLILS